MSDILKALVKVEYVFYPKDKPVEAGDWASFLCSISEVHDGEPQYKKGKQILVYGIAPTLEFQQSYILVGKFTPHDDYGNQYTILCMNKQIDFDSPKEQRIFLEHVLSDHQINKLYETLPNPFDVIKNGDIKTLKTVKGIGDENAKKIIRRYNDNINNAYAYVELDSYGLTKNTIDRLVDIYHSADTLVQRIRENPYILIEEATNIGWARADQMALNAGWEKDSPARIGAYIVFIMSSLIEQGNNWIAPQDLIETTFAALDIDNVDNFREALYSLHDKKYICWNEEKTKIAWRRLFILENNIACDLHRLMSAPSTFCYDNFDFKIREIERVQGFDFTVEQKDAIKTVLNNQVSIITGGGGVGKSTAVYGVLKMLGACSFAQTALSGRAASRLSEITNEDGYTIHRLLEYSPKGGFQRNKDRKLHHEVIILDEVSMVGGDLFYQLIQAIPTGSKLIMIGDDGQLESIGYCNIFKDMLNSGVIPAARLTTIHRQAEKSAIITESKKVRTHKQLVPQKWVGEEIRGELHDLELNIYNDAILSQKRIIAKFEELYNIHRDIQKIQIVVPMRYRGDISTAAINQIIQDMVNPKGANEITIVKNEFTYKLREGDKVIVTENNYKTTSPDGEEKFIFNGNRGIITNIHKANKLMVVDFEQWGRVHIKRDCWKTIEPGYALTCHKLQGSEADYVIIGLDFTARALLTKEWLYTAITRAKKYCVLCAETNALAFTITNSNIPYKRTFLKEMLQERARPQD